MGEVLTNEMCREAKRTLPRPKVGEFCTWAMEQGFSDACIALCLEQKPVARVAQTCRAAAIEMPRPTVRKWCETGYNVAYQKTIKDLSSHFTASREPNKNADGASSSTKTSPTDSSEPPEEITTLKEGDDMSPTVTDASTNKVKATIPVTLNDNNTLDLEIMEGQNVEDAVVAFCREHVKADVSACIRQLLPEVLDKYNAEDKMLRG